MNIYKKSKSVHNPLTTPLNSDFKVRELVKVAGNSGVYQRRVMFILLTINYFFGFVFLCQALLFKQPTFLCQSSDKSWKECNQKTACSEGTTYKIADDFKNFITLYKLYCNRHEYYEIGRIGVQIGSLVLTLVIGITSMYIGRKGLFHVSWVLTLFGSILILIRGYTFNLIGLCLLGTAYDVFLVTAFTYIGELFSSRKRVKYVPLVFVFTALGAVTALIVSEFVYKYTYLPVPALICVLLTFVGTKLFVESPFFVNNKGTINELFSGLNYINEINHNVTTVHYIANRNYLKRMIFTQISVSDLDLEDEEVEVSVDSNDSDKEPKYYKMKKKNKKKHEKLLLSVKLLGLAFIIQGVLNLFMLGMRRIGQNKFAFNLIMACFCVPISFILAYFIIPKFKRKKILRVYLFALILIPILLILISWDKLYSLIIGQVLDTILSYILLVISLITITLIPVLIVESFNTKLRVLIMSLMLTIGRLSFIGAVFLEELTYIIKVTPLAFTSVFGLLGLLALINLKETINNKLEN